VKPSRRTAVLSLVALVAEVSAPALARSPEPAAPGPAACRTRSVLVAVTGPGGPELVDFRRAVGDALARYGCYRAVDTVETLEAGMAAGLARVDAGRAALEQGQQAFLDMRLPAALKALDKAVEGFSAGFGHLAHTGPLVEALLTLGAARAATGDAAGARKAFVGALHLRADADVADVSSMDEVAAAFAAAKGEVRAGRTGNLYLDSEPAEAEAWLDGRYLGPTPYDETGVATGLHWVVVRKAGYERRSAMVDVPDGGTASVRGSDMALAASRRRPLYESALAKLARGGPERVPKDGIEDLKALFLSDLLLVFDPGPGGLSASLWDLETMERTWSGVDAAAASGYGRGAALDLVARAMDSLEARARVQESGAATMKARGGIASKWWFWTVLGVVVVGGVAAAVLLTRDTGGGPEGLPQDGSGAVIVRF
jgi:hypothetical protein